MPDITFEGKRLRLSPANAIGKGGEADIYDLGDGRVLKLFKTPDHPDLSGDPALQHAAAQRLVEHQRKLKAFPRGLPSHVVVPGAFAFDKKSEIAGYAMPFVKGATELLRFSDRTFRATVADGDVCEIFLDLHATVHGVHAGKCVVGDFNDLNVLVKDAKAYLIDTDSFQFGVFRCHMFTERFVDPLLCDANETHPVLVSPHTENSDWYAYAVMLMQSLLFVDPYGGIYLPKDPKKRIPHGARPLKRITVFHPDVRYPKPARPYGLLPDDLLQQFHQIFEKDARGMFPTSLLSDLRWTICTSCGASHARNTCPICKAAAPAAVRETTVIRGKVTATRMFRVAEMEKYIRPRPATFDPKSIDADLCGGHHVIATNAAHGYWTTGGALWRDGRFGPERIGDVLSGQTQIWVGPAFGFGLSRAGEFFLAFVFDAEHAGINDAVKLPRIRGQMISTHAAFTDQLCWWFAASREKGKTVNRCILLDRDGHVLASADAVAGDGTWLGHIGGACAVGKFLFVPTDDGIVRVEIDGTNMRVTNTYPDTEPFVDASTRLFIGAGGIIAVRSATDVQVLKIA